MTTDVKKFQEPDEKEIAEYAYYLWESEGRIDGRDLDYWLQAKTHLTAAKQHEAGLLKTDFVEPAPAKSQPSISSSPPTPLPSKPKKKRQSRSVREPAYA